MNITDFSLKLNGFPIQQALADLRQIQNIPEADFKSHVERQKQEIVDFHLQHNAFYQSLYKTGASWEDLPILTKKNLQAPLTERLSKGYSTKDVYVNKTSGSTGDPFYFAKDKYTHALTWAVIQNRFNWHDLYGKKQARFYGIPKEKKARYKERLKDVFSNRFRFNVFDLSEKALDNWMVQFQNTSYRYLNGYTTVIVAFASHLAKKGMVLKEICPSLQACVVTSEMCFESDKLLMEQAFGVPVINEYGASELDLIAFQDTNNQWILNKETLFIEVLDQENRPLPYGETGKLVITSLYNKAHPFIRYEIGDVGAIEPLNNKQFILKSLQGRKEDLVKLPSGKVAPGLTFYYVTKSIMKDNGEVNEIKVIQTKLDAFEIHYSGKKELTETDQQGITQALFDYLEPNLRVSFIKFDQLPRSKSGKLKQFASLLKSETLRQAQSDNNNAIKE
ncbi:MAG: phenylacetate--CoA ligase family protein [Flavobacteriaceae bacterium]|nr:phenylacetate--CoA ligase family protein [Flavobacteriaceae bacterium]